MITDEDRTQLWLNWLRDGSESDKLRAWRRLANAFEARGMLDEAIELLRHGSRRAKRFGKVREERTQMPVRGIAGADLGEQTKWLGQARVPRGREQEEREWGGGHREEGCMRCERA